MRGTRKGYGRVGTGATDGKYMVECIEIEIEIHLVEAVPTLCCIMDSGVQGLQRRVGWSSLPKRYGHMRVEVKCHLNLLDKPR